MWYTKEVILYKPFHNLPIIAPARLLRVYIYPLSPAPAIISVLWKPHPWRPC
jgi:hypothetical protein